MTVLPTISLLTAAVLFSAPSARPADLIDYPGPGYREQIDKVLPPARTPAVRISSPSVRIFRETEFGPAPFSSLDADAFSQPIRLFRAAPLGLGETAVERQEARYFLLDAPGPAYREQRDQFAPLRTSR